MPDPTVGSRAEVEIALKDSLSPGLRSMAREIRALNRSIKQMGDDGEASLGRMGKSTGGLSTVTRAAVRDLTVMGNFFSGFTRGVLGSVGTVAAIEAVTRSLHNMAESRVALSLLSQDTRQTAQDIEVMRRAMARMGLDAKQSDGLIGGLSTKLQEMQALRQSSQLFRDLSEMGPKGTELAEKILGNKGDHKKSLDDILEVYERQGPEQQFWLSQKLGVPQSVLGNMREYRDKVDKAFITDEKQAKQYIDNLQRMKEYGGDQWSRYAGHVVEKINEIVNAMRNKPTGDKNALSDWLIQDFDNFIAKARATREEIEGIANAIRLLHEAADPKNAKNAIQDKFSAFGLGNNLGKRLDQAFNDVAKENTRVLTEIRDILLRQEGMDTRTGGGGDGSGYGRGIRQEGGAAQASLGGFRPQRYGAGTRADRNNNPGNIEYGEFARRMGATGSDGRFAIFPDRETGFKAAEALLSGKGYEGKTLSEIGQKWSNGDTRWAQNVSRATGIPLGTVPNAEQRSKIARLGMPYAEGTSLGGAGAANGQDGAIPSSILEQAKKAALSGGPQAVYNYIRAQGYNVNSAWCGDFAAAVVTAAGGTPPKNPQVASNWRNFGKEVGDPQPGDIAVRRNSRFGGGAVPTGATGSHVTVVEGADGTMFTGIGGNQGHPRSRFSVNQYQFFRSNIDRENKKPSVFELGTAAVKVDFGNVPPGVRTNAEGTGVFKELQVSREPQSPKAGNPGTDFSSRWYFQ